MNRLLIVILMFHVAYAAKKTIECEYKILDRHEIGNLYTCEVNTDPMITEPFEEDAEFTGEHLLGKSNADVQWFSAGSLHSLRLHYFPRGLSKTFKNLKWITIWDAGLKEIHKEDFESLSELEFIIFNLNKIEVLEQDLFCGNPKMKTLGLHNNQIKYIHPTALNCNLNNLEVIYLNNNKCIDEWSQYFAFNARRLARRASTICNGDISIYNAYLEQKQARQPSNDKEEKPSE